MDHIEVKARLASLEDFPVWSLRQQCGLLSVDGIRVGLGVWIGRTTAVSGRRHSGSRKGQSERTTHGKEGVCGGKS